MAEIRCPMCAKNNSDQLDVCEHCGARLKPLTAPLDPIKPGEIPTKKDTSELERTLPGWLRDAREEGLGGEEVTFDAGETDDNSPIDSAADDNFTFETEASPIASADDLPDFLKDISTEPQKEEPTDLLAGLMQTNGDGDEELPDWMSSLRTEQPAETAQPAISPVLPTAVEEPNETKAQTNEMDWGFAEEKTEPTDEPQTLESPDWLSSLQAQSDQQNNPPTTFDQPEASQETPISGDLPDWLNEMGGSALTPASADEPLINTQADTAGDWLANLGNETLPADSPQPESSSQNDSQLDGDLPDWLSTMQSEPAPQESKPVIAADDSDWLTNLNDNTQTVETTENNNSANEDLPDWLSTSLPSDSIPESPAAINPTSDSDWLTNLTPVTETSQTENEEAMPDWLATAEQESTQTTPAVFSADTTAFTAKPFGTGTLGEVDISSTDAETPDWLSGLQSASAGMGVLSEVDAVENGSAQNPFSSFEESTAGEPALMNAIEQNDVVSEDPFDDLRNASTELNQTDADFSAPVFAESGMPNAGGFDSTLSMDDMPDWLSSFAPQESDSGKTLINQPQGDDADIARANLPSWVQAMRPVESAASQSGLDEFQSVVEEKGPLAGLQNVLPFQQGILEVRKPRVYSIKLQADETQQAQAALLEQIIASETEPSLLPEKESAVTIRPLRWTVSAILLLTAFVISLLGSVSLPSPALTDDTATFINTVNALPSAAPVLLVFDYQPGSAGEMESLVVPITNHLMNRDARLVFVSTSATGPFMASRILNELNSQNTYTFGNEYVDLGYLPGGSSGVLVFANNPRQALEYDEFYGNLWDLQVLKGVETLEDFSVVVVFSDNPDDARLWVEQAQPKMAGKPMLMAVSAQAEPMIRPYYDSGQLQGLVTGLAGGLAYDTANGRFGQARHQWDTYGYLLVVVEVMIAVGSLWGILMALRTRNQKQQDFEG